MKKKDFPETSEVAGSPGTTSTMDVARVRQSRHVPGHSLWHDRVRLAWIRDLCSHPAAHGHPRRQRWKRHSGWRRTQNQSASTIEMMLAAQAAGPDATASEGRTDGPGRQSCRVTFLITTSSYTPDSAARNLAESLNLMTVICGRSR